MASLTVIVEPFTPSAFQAFGCCIENPVATSERSGLQLNHVSIQEPVSANQGTAKKYVDVSPMLNLYDMAPSRCAAKPIMSFFVCTPRRLRPVEEKGTTWAPRNEALLGWFDLTIMERHPFTTQTFIPLGLDAQDQRTAYLIVVAPTITASGEDISLPDISGVRAFLAHGSQAVTYGAGTWHAPMIVIGERHMDFLVTQYANDVAEEDCEEVEFTSMVNDGVRIAVPCIGNKLSQAAHSKL